MLTKNTEKALQRFKDHVISRAKANLTRQGKKSSGNLYDNLQGNVQAYKNSIEVNLDVKGVMKEYGTFVDKGVSGTEKRYNTPFKYKQSSNLVGLEYHTGIFSKWAKQRNFRLRDEKGRYAQGNYKSIGYILAKSIKKKGFKPSLFFTKPFEAAFKNLPDELIEAYALDIKSFLEFTTNKK